MSNVTRRNAVRGAVALAFGTWVAPTSHGRAQAYRILDATETVRIEHQDRVARLRRAGVEFGVRPPPRFEEIVVAATQLPENFHVDTPVLRVMFDERSFFDTGADRILPGAQNIIRAVAEALRGDAPDAAVFVAGHSDNRGTEAYNYALSARRADAVAEALYQTGVGDVALWRVGFGEAVPLYPNDNPEHMAFNRRVEFLFSARAEPILDVLKRQLDHVCVADNQSESARCVREIRLRSTFEAVQVTSRRLGVGLNADVASITPEERRSAINVARPGAELDPPPRRVSINLRSRRYSIETPRK